MAEQDLGSAAFVFGNDAKVGDINVKGNVVGRDLTIEAQGVDRREQLLDVLTALRAQVQALKEAPAGQQQSALDELANARAAGERQDDSQLVEGLESARSVLERIGLAVPAAITLAQAIATLIQRVPGLS